MISYFIPGFGQVALQHLILDFNGTLAVDGRLVPGVAEKLKRLSELLNIHVITADTNETVRQECVNLPVRLIIARTEGQAEQKKDYVLSLPRGSAVCIGNGANDELMLQEAALAISILGEEGCFRKTLLQSDIVATRITDALELLLQPNRLTATLRK